MKELTLTIRINRPVKDVFAFTINPENTPKWIDAIVEEKANEYPPKLGTIYRNLNAAGEWRELALTSFESDKMFTLSQEDGFHVSYTFTPINANTSELEFYEWLDDGELDVVLTMDVLTKLKSIIEEGA